MSQTLIAVFEDEQSAQRARDDLVSSGIGTDKVSMKPSGKEKHGGFVNWLKSLFGMEQEADRYGEAVRRGHCVLTVDVDDDQIEGAQTILANDNAIDMNERSSWWQSRGWSGYDENAPDLDEEERTKERAEAPRARIPVVKEDVVIGKQTVDGVVVHVVKRVLERPVEQEVTLREEHVVVERVPVDRPATPEEASGMKDETITVQERSERPVVEKTARVKEEVEVGTEAEEHTETVRERAREEHVDVERAAKPERDR